MPQRIYNQNAYVEGQWNVICDRCGFKFKSSELRREWNGLYTCRDCWEVRQPLDFIRGIPDNPQVAWTRPDTNANTSVTTVSGASLTTDNYRDAVGDVDKTLTVGTDNMIQIWNTTLTENRFATLSTSGAENGDRFILSKTDSSALSLIATQNNRFAGAYNIGGTDWTDNGSPVITLNNTADPFGRTQASTIEDNDGAANAGTEQTLSITDSLTTTVLFVKKDNDETRFPALYVAYNSVSPRVVLTMNTKTGAYVTEEVGSPGNVNTAVTSYDDNYWKVLVSFSDPGAHTQMRIVIIAAYNSTLATGTDVTATGSIDVWGAFNLPGYYTGNLFIQEMDVKSTADFEYNGTHWVRNHYTTHGL